MKKENVIHQECEICGYEIEDATACKMKCPNCGFTLDCSDPK